MKIFKTAIVLTLVGVLCGALIGFANYVTAPIIEKNKQEEAMKAYKGFFNDLDNIEEVDLNEGTAYSVVKIFKNNNIIGYVFKAKGTNPRGLVDLAIGVDVAGEIVGVKILDTENTIGFYDKYIPVLDKISSLIGELNGVDIIGGVTQTGDLLNTLIKDIVKAAGEFINIEEPLNVYEELFGEGYAEAIEDETFTATENVLKKEEVKDASGNSLGFAYTVFGVTEEFLHEEYKKEYGELTLLVALDADNKVIGIRTLISTHTGNYYDKYEAEYEKLVGKVLEGTVNVDLITGSTVSGNSITKLIEALKGVLS